MFADIDFHRTLGAAQQGDKDALDLLFTRCYPLVQSAVHKSLASSTRRNRPWLISYFSTGDVVQEVFISVLRDVASLRGATENNFIAFLTSLVRNRLIDTIRFHEAMQRSARSTEELGETNEPTSGSPVPEAAIRAETIANFCRIFGETPARERDLLVERIQHERTFADLARELGYPSEDAARKAFYAAQARLLLRLTRAGLDPEQGR